ncbi:MAG: hypothetical protein WC563_10405 [Brevundimonas sp.]|jgi:hypothetical protein
MIRDHRTITTAQAGVLTALNGNRSLQRAASLGQPFRVAFDDPEPGRERPAFPEALILDMIEQGLLIGTQAAAAWPARNLPIRPFCVRLTKEGDQERRRLLTGVTSPENDDALMPNRAA